MRVIFVAAGPKEWGSSRMRAWWVAPYMDNAEVIQYGQPIPTTADAYIWQKMVNMEVVEATPHARHVWDVCDPAWWWEPQQCLEIAAAVDSVVASSEALASDFYQWHSSCVTLSQDKRYVHTIPDRLELSHFTHQRQHADVSPVRFIWFGVAVNRIALYAAVANLERLAANGYKIELTVMDDRPDVPFRITDSFPIYNVPWRLDREVEVLSNHDIALLPPYPGAWGKVKSNNKLITAALCGLATLGHKGNDHYHTFEQYVKDVNVRYGMARGARGNAVKYRDVRQSAAEWETILNG